MAVIVWQLELHKVCPRQATTAGHIILTQCITCTAKTHYLHTVCVSYTCYTTKTHYLHTVCVSYTCYTTKTHCFHTIPAVCETKFCGFIDIVYRPTANFEH